MHIPSRPSSGTSPSVRSTSSFLYPQHRLPERPWSMDLDLPAPPNSYMTWPPHPDLKPILVNLDVALPTSVRNKAFIMLVKKHQEDPIGFKVAYQHFAADSVSAHTPISFRQIFSASSLIFPIIAEHMSLMIMNEDWLEQIERAVENLRDQLYNDRSRTPSQGTSATNTPPVTGAESYPTPPPLKHMESEEEKDERQGAERRVDALFTEAVFELFSVAVAYSLDVKNRINTVLGDWIEKSYQNPQVVEKPLHRLILVKLGRERNFITPQGIDLLVSDLVQICEQNSDELSELDQDRREKDIRRNIECLAYLSRHQQVKERLIRPRESQSTQLVSCLKRLLESEDTAAETLFGSLSILDNLTTYPPRLSEDQANFSSLKSYASAQTPTQPSTQLPEPDSAVDLRNTFLMSSSIVSTLIKRCGRPSITPASKAAIVSILLSFSKQSPNRRELVRLGALKLLLAILPINTTTAENPGSKCKEGVTTPPNTILFMTTLCLARLLIATNPSLATSSAATPLISSVKPLITLLHRGSDPQSIYPEKYASDILPQYEALLALTNLASIPEGGDNRTMIVTHGFQILTEELILSPNAQVQRASVELLCNLMQNAECVEKFAAGAEIPVTGETPESRAARQRLRILIALTDASEPKTRSAAAGAVAMFSEWGAPACAALIQEDLLVRRLEAIVVEGNDLGLMHRALVVLLNLISVSGGAGADDRPARRAWQVFAAKQELRGKLQELGQLNTGAGAGTPVVELARNCAQKLSRPFGA